MVALLIALFLAGPPRATLDGVPLAVSSWCWGTHCGAPIAASTRTVSVARGSTVTVQLAFEPVSVHVAIAGVPERTVVGTHAVTWRATRAGGVTITATGGKGWVTYVGRLRIRP
ncbi:MAG TPA: hypothetical protein VI408_03185 [Gaiellaceae bacterium]